MKLAMVQSAKRNGKLITDFAAQRTGLRKPEMMGVGRRAATNYAWLRSHEFAVRFVAQAKRFCHYPNPFRAEIFRTR